MHCAAESAVECARSYALYGAALLEKARCDSDVFGAKVQDAAKAKTEALIQEAMAEGEAAGASQVVCMAWAETARASKHVSETSPCALAAEL